MVNTCHVTGIVISPDGDPVPRATVRFQRRPHEVFVEDDKTGIPREVRAEADEDGNIAVDLIPGEYKVLIIARGYNQYPAFNVGVPDQPTAVLADIQDVPPPPSLDDATRAVRDAREARDDSREARDEAAASAQAAADAAQGAEDHATAAAASAQAAADSETAAATSAGSAATSASNAAASAAAASDSASAAATSEQNAATSASAAADSASAASTSASNADDAKQAAEAAAQTAVTKAGEASDSAQDAVDAAAAIPAMLIGPSVMARYNPSRLVVYDNCVRDVSVPTDAHGLQTPSGHTWEAVARDTGETGVVNPILEYRPNGVLFASRSPIGSAMSETPFSLIADTPWLDYKRLFGKFHATLTPNWARGLVLNWIDPENFLLVSAIEWTVSLEAFSDNIQTRLGIFGSLNNGSSFARNALDISASVYDTHVIFSPTRVGVRVEANGELGLFAIPSEFEHLVKTPGKIGLFANRGTDFLAFGMEVM